jgi:dimethylglycine catabolism A
VTPDGPALTPWRHGRLSMRNRIAFLATVNNLGRNDQVTDEQIAFYEARARGGVGMVITEGLSVHRTSIPNPTIPLAYRSELVPGLRRLSEAVHRHGTLLIGQLWHVGRQALWNPALQPWAPSADPDPLSGATPHEMSEDDIREVIGGYADTAYNLQRAGFDGAEVHGAHGYLVTQFLSPWSNHRQDRWGGSRDGRVRFLIELLRAIREACGDRFVIGLKLTAHEYVDGGLDLPESQEIVRLVARLAPPDYLGVSQANFSPSLEYHVPDMRFDDGPFVHLARGIRDVVGPAIPVMAMAKVTSVAHADELLTRGVADLIGMSRPLLADADLVRKSAAGEPARPCVYCNVCWQFIHTGREIACIYAPETGREASSRDVADRPLERALDVRVIGAGPAGLEFARTAATRGHEVTLYEAEDHPGGRLLRDASIPGRGEVGEAARWLTEAARKAGVRVVAGERIDDEAIATWPTDTVVVIATGAVPATHTVPGAHRVVELGQALDGSFDGPVVVLDGLDDEPVYAVAEELARRGHEVHLVTPRPAFGRHVAHVSLIGVLRRLDEVGVELHTLAEPSRIEDGTLIVRHVFSTRERPLCVAGTVVSAGRSRAPGPVTTGGRSTLVIGDASAPRSLVAVTREAHDAAREVERLGVGRRTIADQEEGT